ncbi:MAG: hypothetical protein IJ680_02265 [Paludibacteraceae bacterium]|nr:hypothetical protein [Paludibacteraceae bacterium]
MKTIIKSMMLCALALMGIACSSENNPSTPEEPGQPVAVVPLPFDSAVYEGTLDVGGNKAEQVRSAIVRRSETTLCAHLFDASLTPEVPYTFNVLVEPVGYTYQSDGTYLLEGRDLYPVVEGERVDMALEHISGTLQGDQLHIEFVLADTKIVYDGTYVAATQPVTEPVANTLPATGTVTVNYQDKDYDTPDSRVAFEFGDGQTFDLQMYQMKFVPQMPVKIDITVPSVSFKEADGKYVFSATDIVPTSGGNAYDRYLVTDLTGSIDTQTGDVEFSLLFGPYPTRFKGTLTKPQVTD